MSRTLLASAPVRHPSESEVYSFVSKIISQSRQSNLIKILQTVQNKYGYLPKAGLKAISHLLNIPLSKVYGVATFYHQFKLEPPGKYRILVCMGTACHARGNTNNYEFLRLFLGLDSDKHVTKDGVFSLEQARCFGCCSLAPVVMIVDNDGFQQIYGHATPTSLRKIINEYRAKFLEKVVVHAIPAK